MDFLMASLFDGEGRGGKFIFEYAAATLILLGLWVVALLMFKYFAGFKMICDEPLHGLRCHDSGEMIAVGNDIGTTYIIEISEKFVKSTKNDKAYLTAMFERESRREKIIEGKLREQRLKMRTRHENVPPKTSYHSSQQTQSSIIESITKEFFEQISGTGCSN